MINKIKNDTANLRFQNESLMISIALRNKFFLEQIKKMESAFFFRRQRKSKKCQS